MTLYKQMVLGLCIMFLSLCGANYASANDLSTTPGDASTPGYVVDEDGKITGTVGAKYYNVNTWKDMFDTYKGLSGTGSQQVVFNLIGNVAGESSFNTGVAIVEGVGVTIRGNDYTLYAGDTPTAASGTGRDNTAGFYSSSTSTTNQTVLNLENAKVVNANANGIFPITSTATVQTNYHNVAYRNGPTNAGASPLRNDRGTIQLSGTNTFSIVEGSDDAGIDNQGEWIQGAYNVEIISGTTTLTQSWGNDQPIYAYGNTGNTIKVHDNAKLVWNLDRTYTMYYDDGNSGPLVWDIGNNASFIINGTEKTASRNSNWFMSTAFSAWTLNVGDNSEFKVKTGGGSINTDTFANGVVWNFGKDSKIEFDNLNTSRALVSGVPKTGSAMNVNDAESVTLKSAGSTVFSSTTNLPIKINGVGLRLHASTDYSGSNQTNDLWKRVTTGTTDGTFSSATMTPTEYTSSDLNYLKTAKFIQWFKPTGMGMNASDINRTFDVKLNELPLNGDWSDLINGNAEMNLNFADDRGVSPNFEIQVSQLSNETVGATDYYWKNKGDDQEVLLTDNPLKIATINDDSNLPSNVTMTMAGGNYQFNYPENAGLLLKAKNSLKVQESENAKIQYSIVNGPGSD